MEANARTGMKTLEQTRAIEINKIPARKILAYTPTHRPHDDLDYEDLKFLEKIPQKKRYRKKPKRIVKNKR